MRNFYVWIDFKGKHLKGIFEASDEENLATVLFSMPELESFVEEGVIRFEDESPSDPLSYGHMMVADHFTEWQRQNILSEGVGTYLRAVLHGGGAIIHYSERRTLRKPPCDVNVFYEGTPKL